MEQEPELAAILLTHSQARFAPPADAAALEGLLNRALEAARAQWPSVALSSEVFVRHLAERLPEPGPERPLVPLLEQLSLPELYLACACVHDIAGAIEAFEQHYLAKLPGLLAYLKQPDALIDDVCQLTRVRLLVRTPGSGPRLNDYTGRGSLLSWVRVTAVRIALKLFDTGKPAPDKDVAAVIEALPAPGADAELDLIKQRHQAELRQAVHEAFATLSSDERHLLRLYFVDRLSTPELGALLGVNQSTVSRWLKSARKTVYTETRRRLQARLDLSARGFQSFLAVIDSQVDLSLSQLFESTSNEG